MTITTRMLFIFVFLVGCKTMKNSQYSALSGSSADSIDMNQSLESLEGVSLNVQRKLQLEGRNQQPTSNSKVKKTKYKKRISRKRLRRKKKPVVDNVASNTTRSTDIDTDKVKPKKHTPFIGNQIHYSTGTKKVKTRRATVFVKGQEDQPDELYAAQGMMQHIHLKYQVHIPRKRKDSLEILKLVQQVDPELRNCYIEHIATVPKYFEGNVTYAFKIKKMSQSFNRLALKSRRPVAEDLKSCIKLTLGRLRFTNGHAYKGNLRLSFKKVHNPKKF